MYLSMPKLLFFSRVAFLCNLCFLFTFLINYIPSINLSIISIVLVIGLVLSLVMNFVVNISYLLATFAGKSLSLFIPRWIVVANFLFFICQAILLLK